jgi:Na+-driven multidrug efflux pump
MFNDVAKPIIELIQDLAGPLLGIVGAAGTVFSIILGVKYAKAEEPQDREKAKQHLKNAIIGFVLIFVLILALTILMPNLVNWVNERTGETIIETVAP